MIARQAKKREDACLRDEKRKLGKRKRERMLA